MIKRSLLLIMLLVCRIGYTQTIFKFGPELGFSFSEFPHRGASLHDPSTGNQLKEIYYPLLSPVIGFNSELILFGRLYLLGGLQYQMTGDRIHIHREEVKQITPPVTNTLILDTWIKQTFHKLCLPLTLGYSFKIKNIHSAVFIGYRPNLFTYGKYAFIEEGSYMGKNNYYEFVFNPFSKENLVPFKRFNNQITAGSLFRINKNTSLKFCFYYGSEHGYFKDVYIGRYFLNNDFILTISYLFSSDKKNE